MFSQYMEELDTQEQFQVEEFVERLTWRTKSEGVQEIEPDILLETFQQTIKDLRILQERQQKKCEKLENLLSDEQKVHAKNIDKLQDKHQVTFYRYVAQRFTHYPSCRLQWTSSAS